MDDILSRSDGRTARKTIKATSQSNDTFGRTPLSERPSKTKSENQTASKQHDGFDTIIHCRWCGNVMGQLYIPDYKDGFNGKPHEMVVNYTPCPECQKKWSNMVTIIEVMTKEPYPDALPLDENAEQKLYPTGRHVGVTEEAARGAIDPNCKNGMIFFMDEDMFKSEFENYFNPPPPKFSNI